MILSTRIRILTALMAGATLAVVATTANATTLNWNVAGPADWWSGGNWNPPGPPTPTDRADISNGGTAYIDSNVGTIQRFEMAGPVGTSGFLEIRSGGSLTTNDSGNTYVGSRGLGILTIEPGATLNIASGPFYVGWRGDGGAHGDGTVIQNGGTVTMGRYVDLAREDANTEGRYEIHDGTLTIAEWLQVGRQGTGTFIQTDGIVTVSRSGDAVMVGAQGDSTGTYTMSGGELRIPNGHLYVGQSGNAQGTFTQTGGTVTANAAGRDVFLGYGANNVGSYNLGGTGTLISDDLYVGFNGTGNFHQTGGTLNTRTVLLARNAGSQGDYTMSGGTVTASGDIRVGILDVGTFTQSGGTVQTSTSTQIGPDNGGNGTLRLSGAAQWTTPELFVGNNGTGVLNVADTAQMNVTTTGTNFRIGNGSNSDGTVNQTGGTVTQPGTGAMYLGFESTAIGRYNISGGTLDQGSLTIGGNNGGTGIVTQSGGDVYAHRDVRIGRGSGGDGSYSISDGTLSITGSHLGVGYDGSATGTFTQTGGAVQVAQNLLLGNASGNTGTYTMDAGTLTLTGGGWDSRIQVGYQGHGTFIQNGGDVLVDAFVNLASESASTTGRYEIHGGTLTLPDTTRGYLQIGRLGTGTFVQTGGAVLANRTADAVTIAANSAGAVGTYLMSGGTLDAPNGPMLVGKLGTGTFIQQAGDVAIGDSVRLAVNSASSAGRYEIHDGSLTVGTYLQVGRLGTGTFIQTGGTVTVNRTNDALIIGSHGGGQGTYRISGGTLDVVNHTTFVGQGGTGLLDVLGSAADIDTVGFSQNASSSLRTAIDNGGISTIDVAGNASISGGAALDVDIWGGVALTQTTAFELLRTATAGNVSGTFTVIDPEPLWAVTQDGTVVQAALAPPGQGTVTAGYAVPGDILVNGGAGSSNDWVGVDGMWPGEQTFVFLDIIEPGDTVDSGELDALAAYITSGGNPAYSDHPLTAPGTGLDKYDLAVEFFPSTAAGYFAWDLTDFNAENNKNLLVAGLAVGVPEPSSLALLGVGLIGLGLAGLRRKRPGAG